MYKVLKIGSQKSYEFTDLYKLDDFMEFQNHLSQFEQYKDKKLKLGWSFNKILLGWMFPIWIFIFVGFLSTNLLGIANPYLLELFINWMVRPLTSL